MFFGARTELLGEALAEGVTEALAGALVVEVVDGKDPGRGEAGADETGAEEAIFVLRSLVTSCNRSKTKVCIDG